MCTLIETSDIKILVDPGLALGPRFNLLPHPIEYELRESCRNDILSVADKADILTISHYHNDHYMPAFSEPVWIGSSKQHAERLFKDKIVLAKDARSRINFAQRRRGWLLRKSVGEQVKEWHSADGQTFEYGATRLRFSQPMIHGEESGGLGWLLMLTVETAEDRVIHASDVQGPLVEETVQSILSEKPRMLIIGGPPTYLIALKNNPILVSHAIKNMKRLALEIPIVVVDHHLLRDEGWNDILAPVKEVAKANGHEVLVAAELSGRDPAPLEYRRKELYERLPPPERFLKWARLPAAKRKLSPPPLVGLHRS
jgi:predicted metallo-beta-lactamase superfamily hydrolase